MDYFSGPLPSCRLARRLGRPENKRCLIIIKMMRRQSAADQSADCASIKASASHFFILLIYYDHLLASVSAVASSDTKQLCEAPLHVAGRSAGRSPYPSSISTPPLLVFIFPFKDDEAGRTTLLSCEFDSARCGRVSNDTVHFNRNTNWVKPSRQHKTT